MPIRRQISYVLLLLLGGVSSARAAEVAPEKPDQSAIVARSARLHDCFLEGLRHLEREDQTLKTSPLAEAYFLDQLPDDPRDLLRMNIEAFCVQIVQGYKFAHKASQRSLTQDKKQKPALGGAGTRPIDSQSSFLRFAQKNSAASHIAGHSDITETAVKGLVAPRFGDDALILLARAAQAPDLYRWNSDSHHAQTPEHGIDDRATRIQAGKAAFLALELELLERFRLAAQNPATADQALFILGIACHAIQDLAYHRGMSLREHSGLSYFRNRNPDTPPAGEREQRQKVATTYTARILTLARNMVGESVWRHLVSWEHPGEWDFFRLASQVFNQREQDMTSTALLDYWMMSLDYRLGRRNRAELDLAARGTWDADKLVDEVEAKTRSRTR